MKKCTDRAHTDKPHHHWGYVPGGSLEDLGEYSHDAKEFDPSKAGEQILAALEQLKKTLNEAGATLKEALNHSMEVYQGMPARGQLEERVTEWAHHREGQFIDSGAYGPQGPDLIMDYIRSCFPNGAGWLFPEIFAKDFGETDDKFMHENFYKCGSAGLLMAPRLGDIVVAESTDGPGYVGVVTEPELWLDSDKRFGQVPIFAQSPIFPPGQLRISRKAVKGGWRPKVRY